MAYAADVKELPALVSSAVDTAANWASENPVVPAGAWCYESDTGKLKIGDGTSLWGTLSYKVDAVLTTAQKALLDNAGAANGVAILDANGKLTSAVLPSGFMNSVVVYKATYADLATATTEDKKGLVFVIDATGDTTVKAGSAQYIWNSTGSKWDKIGEMESMDQDFSAFFNKTTDNMDSILDGTTYVRFSAANKAILDGLDKNAVRYTDSIVITGISAAQMKAMTTPAAPAV